MKLFFKKYILAFIVWLFYKILSSTWRVTIYESPALKKHLKDKVPVIFAHWHGDEIPLVSLTPRYKIATIASSSNDGQMMSTIIHLLGGKTSLGSSTRGGVTALKGLIRLVKNENRNVSFAVDGPKGPIYEVKPGVFEFSRLLKGPIYSAGVACDRAWVFHKAWNRAFLPKPFAKIFINWSETPLPAINSDQDPRSAELAASLADALRNSKEQALKKIAT